MLKLKEGQKEVGVELLEYEYPPGWGAGMPYNTDYLICRIRGKDGERAFELEDSFFRFSELEEIYENCLAILDGDSYGFEATIEDPRVGFYVEIEDDLLSVNFQIAGETLFSVGEKQNPVEFEAMTRGIDEALREIARL
ncbi:MAG: hypothetical protein SPI65_04370 [Peptoniphilus sp.]|nr:hypothetical protein [Peptoniphilus sp.]MDD7363497.1 hypothetical protein [Bacillota bacterium]MDY6044799.1 hypothetical protein [Peptoniphilus sp.]